MDFVVPGNDRIHVYRWQHDLSFGEVSAQEYPFRDLTLLSGVMCMDARGDGKGGVLVALGCQDGTVALGNFPAKPSAGASPSSAAVWRQYQLDGPVSCLSLFSVAVCPAVAPTPLSSDSRMSAAVVQGVQLRATSSSQNRQIHLVVGGALGYAALFADVDNQGFDIETYLPHSEEYDSILCVAVVDLDLHGRHQILLGTFNQRVLIYQTCSEADLSYELVSTLAFDHPVFAIDSADLSRNGLEELIITTMYSVQVFEHDMDAVISQLRMKEELISEIIGLEKTFKFLSTVVPESESSRSSLSSPSFIGASPALTPLPQPPSSSISPLSNLSITASPASKTPALSSTTGKQTLSAPPTPNNKRSSHSPTSTKVTGNSPATTPKSAAPTKTTPPKTATTATVKPNAGGK